MSAISAIQALNPGEAWQAFLQATVNEAEPPPTAPSEATPEAASLSAPLPVQATPQTRPTDMPVTLLQHTEAASVVLPMAPVLLQPLSLQNGPQLRWRVQDAPRWRQLFDDAGSGDEMPDGAAAEPVTEAVDVEAMPPWALALLGQLREAATDAAPSAAALRPALQAWRMGLPVLLASPVGLASLQPSRDATVWQWRRWPARWRTARPAVNERWWAVRMGLSAQGRPRTLRELAGATRLPPGQVSCELRLDDVAPGIAQWTEVLVQAPPSASLRTLLGARPSLTWLLCNQPLWPREAA